MENRLSVTMYNKQTGEIEDYYTVTHIAVKPVCEFAPKDNRGLSSFTCNSVIVLYFDGKETTYKLFNADKWEIHSQQ